MDRPDVNQIDGLCWSLFGRGFGKSQLPRLHAAFKLGIEFIQARRSEHANALLLCRGMAGRRQSFVRSGAVVAARRPCSIFGLGGTDTHNTHGGIYGQAGALVARPLLVSDAPERRWRVWREGRFCDIPEPSEGSERRRSLGERHLVQREDEHLAVAVVAIANGKGHEIFACVVGGLSHNVVELGGALRIADQQEAAAVLPNLVGG
ncbi:hypothetical protein [Brevundimonas sp.]|uniref:hypothetical protein n=1 Tax=Brevundimonas sp. TaxID=1871086 RepID=UPI0028A6AA26|nr:hypothetical protein [Brevundimonas sp.]